MTTVVITRKRKNVSGLGMREKTASKTAADQITKMVIVTQIYLIKLIVLSQRGQAEYTPIQCLYVSAVTGSHRTGYLKYKQISPKIQ